MKKIAIVGANSYIARNIFKVLQDTRNDCRIDLYDFAECHVDGEERYKSIRILDQGSVKSIDMNVDVILMFI